MTFRLLERDLVRARAEQVLTAAAAGQGSLLVIEGQAGMGKTAALADIRGAATRAGLRVLRARGARLEREYAFGIVRQLADSALVGRPPATPGAVSAESLGGYFARLESLVEARASLLVVDDAQWADPASLRVLALLAERIDELPAAIILAARPEAGVVALLGATDIVELAPLSVVAVAALVGPDRAAVAHEATCGNPFLVERLGESQLDGEAAVRRAVGRWALSRLGDPGAPTDRLARALAILGDAELGTVAALAALHAQAAEAAARELLAGGVLLAGDDRLRFAQPIVRDGVYAELTGAERAAGHLRAAELVPERAAEHLVHVEPRGDTRIADALIAAAVHAPPERAVAYLRRALAEPPADRAGALLALGLAADAAGDPAAIDDLEAALEAAGPGEPRVRAAIALAGVLRRRGRDEDAAAALELATDDPRLELLLRLARGERVPIMAGAPREALGMAALGAARDGLVVEAATLARRALAAVGGGPPSLPAAGELPWFTDATLALIACECWDDAAAALDEAIARGDAVLAVDARAQRAVLRLRRGDLLGSEADARASLDRALARGVLVESLLDQGRLEEAAGLDAPPFARARVALEQRGFAEAADAFLAAADPLTSWRAYAAIAHAFAGDASHARELADAAVAAARTPRALGIAQRAAGVIALRDERAPDAESLLRAAIVTLERAGDPVELARANVDLGAHLRRVNRRAQARALLTVARDGARTVHADAIVARAEAELDATGARPRKELRSGLDALTASERRVAELATEGLTNPQIAQSLSVTRRTVEGHLTQVFAKLGVDRRQDLPDALHGD